MSVQVDYEGTRKTIPTYIINLKERVERKAHIIKEFNSKTEFTTKIVQAKKHRYGAVGLWKTLVYIIQDLVPFDAEYIILCEDDHQFTENYSSADLYKVLDKARSNDADIILGGVSWLEDIILVDEPLYWISAFTGLQFTIIFQKFFSKILEANFEYNDDADFKISSLTSKKFLFFPFISIQKEFGYSDVTIKNSENGRVTKLFDTSSKKIQRLNDLSSWYSKLALKSEQNTLFNFQDFTLPTYILSSHIDDLGVKREFKGRDEFSLTILKKSLSKNDPLDYTTSLLNIINSALEQDEEVIIICSEHHRFTAHYEAKKFLTTLFEVYREGGTILLGNAENISNATYVSENRWWVDSFKGCSFLVLFRDIFSKILLASQNQSNNTEKLLSAISFNKTLLYPFISSMNESFMHDFPKNMKKENITERDADYRLSQLTKMKLILEGNIRSPN